eukprot:scaffold108468_cov63-Phaeocystis_antarctica.AAC.4
MQRGAPLHVFCASASSRMLRTLTPEPLSFSLASIQNAVGELHAPSSPCRVRPDVPLIVRASCARRGLPMW